MNGDPVSVMIRPERVRIAVTPGHDGCSIEGVIRQLIFQGASARLQLELRDGTEIVAYVDPDDDLPFLHPGSSVHATWSPGAAFLLVGWPAQPGASDSDVDQIEATL
jgi:hypothetical protein